MDQRGTGLPGSTNHSVGTDSSPRIVKQIFSKPTFGIEWEFFIPQGISEIDSHREDTRFHVSYSNRSKFTNPAEPATLPRAVSSFLEDLVPISADIDAYSLRQVIRKRCLETHEGRPRCSYFWAIERDLSLRSCPDEDVPGYDYLAQTSLEIHSRILTEAEFPEVRAVYRRLRNTLRINLNRTCSLHVHVGTGHLDLVGYKKLVTLLMVSERFLYRCCATHRRGSGHCRPVATESRFALEPQTHLSTSNPDPLLRELIPGGLPEALARVLGRVWGAGSVAELRHGLMIPAERCLISALYGNEARRGGAAIRGEQTAGNVYGREVPADPTVEFRYSHASGDAERDERWVRICISLVHMAHVVDDNGFRRVLRSLVQTKALEAFFAVINLREDHGFWEKRAEQYTHQSKNPTGPAATFLAPTQPFS